MARFGDPEAPGKGSAGFDVVCRVVDEVDSFAELPAQLPQFGLRSAEVDSQT
ncbi:hypothetical protein AB0M05_41385 [Streptomyces violaceusniger]|uniref:hypothetical protein n=1 Tax=Streptomyces violaceusniger TaxID=68280 RepID=UPI0034445EC0